MSEAVPGYLQAVGIRARVRPLERAGFFKALPGEEAEEHRLQPERRLRERGHPPGDLRGPGGPYVYGSYPDIDGLFREQAAELDRKSARRCSTASSSSSTRRPCTLPIWELALSTPQGPRVAESGLGLIPGWAFSAPYEDVRLKGK